MKKILAVCAVALCYGAFGADYYLKSVSADWSLATSFTTTDGGSTEPEQAPGSGDTVYIPTSGETALTSGTASFETAANVKRIHMRDGATLVLTVNDTDPVAFNAEICNGNTATAKAVYGTVIKRGTGEVDLQATGAWSYYVHFKLEAGALRLADCPGVIHVYYGDMDICDDATLYCPNVNYVRFRSLNGTSKATVEYDRATGGAQLLVTDNSGIWQSGQQRSSVFAGKLKGTKLSIYTSHCMTLTGSNSTHSTSHVQMNYNKLAAGPNGYLAVPYLGNIGYSSSLGAGTWYNFGMGGGGILYLGKGETSNRAFQILADASYAYDDFFDAGATGGLKLTGEFRKSSEKLENFILTGSNTEVCVFKGSITENPYHGDRPTFFTKKGSGIWGFQDVALSRNGLYGGFDIQEGVLQFDTLSNRNEMCALGLASVLTKGKTVKDTRAATADELVDYAYTIGTKDSGKQAVLEYVGSQCAVSTNRAAVIVGTGTIRSSATGTGWLGFCGGVTVRDAGTATLVLDGTNENDNVVWNLADGGADRTLNVEKRGSGVWKLSGDQTFTGSLKVREGTLKLAGSKYSWYRFTVRETGEPSASKYLGQTCFRKLALYDANGAVQTSGLTAVIPDKSNPVSGKASYKRSSLDWHALAAGSSMIAGSLWYIVSSTQFLDALFDPDSNRATFSASTVTTIGSDNVFSKDNEDTWLPIVMHLSDNAQEIAAYDYKTYYTDYVYQRWPRYVRLEASVDGVAWRFIEDRDFDADGNLTAAKTKSDVWVSDLSTTAYGTARPGKGYRPSGIGREDVVQPLANVAGVSVSQGAVLKTLDSMIELGKVEIDCNDCGTFDGFSLASGSGVLNVRNLGTGADVTLPDCFTNVAGLENVANWTLRVDGNPSGRLIEVRDGRIHIISRGLYMLVR